MALEDRVRAIRTEAEHRGRNPVGVRLQGIDKQRIKDVLAGIDRLTADLVDVVFALLDDRPSWFSTAPDGTRFCDGASTAHLACHVGILQRGERKLDREGRDYWIKSLRDVGAIEPVTLDSATGTFIPGHPVAKSSNSAYRLADEFKQLLQVPASRVSIATAAWIRGDAVRERLELQAAMASTARAATDTKHSNLILAIRDVYVRKFLPSFEVLYVDDGDGARIPLAAKQRLARFGLELKLEDAMPDVFLASDRCTFWVVEAVTSDGEVDMHKVAQVRKFVLRTCPTATVGFTTVYRTWSEAGRRQAKY